MLCENFVKIRYLRLLLIIKAAIAPGTQPAKVSKVTSKTDPHPLSKIESGGNKIQRRTRQIDIRFLLMFMN